MSEVKTMKDGNEFYCDMSNVDWESYLENYMLGIRQYVLKDGLESLPSARRKIAKLYWMKRILQVGFLFFLYHFMTQNVSLLHN